MPCSKNTKWHILSGEGFEKEKENRENKNENSGHYNNNQPSTDGHWATATPMIGPIFFSFLLIILKSLLPVQQFTL